MTGLRSAIGFLTILPGAPRSGTVGFASARMWFPVVGLILGRILAALDLFLNSGYPLTDDPGALPPLLSASLLAVALIVLTRALHMDGLMDCCDALLGGFDRKRRLEVLRDPHVGAFAVTGIVSLLIVKVAAIAAMPPEGRLWVIVVFPCLSRWAVLIAMELFPYVRSPGIGTPFLERRGRWQIVFALAVTLLATLALTGVAGLALMAAASVGAWAIGAWASKLLGGVTGDVYGAAIELAEVLVLILAALLVHGMSDTVLSPILQLDI